MFQGRHVWIGSQAVDDLHDLLGQLLHFIAPRRGLAIIVALMALSDRRANCDRLGGSPDALVAQFTLRILEADGLAFLSLRDAFQYGSQAVIVFACDSRIDWITYR